MIIVVINPIVNNIYKSNFRYFLHGHTKIFKEKADFLLDFGSIKKAFLLDLS